MTESNPPKLISPSSMNCFYECPYNWKLVYLDKKPGLFVTDRERLFGSMCHNIIQAYYKNLPENPTEEEVKATLVKAINDYFDPIFSRRKERLERILLGNFLKFELSRIRSQSRARPQYVEQKFVADPFSCIIDFYNEGLLIDWKLTGISNIANTNHMRQGKICEYVLRRNGVEVKSVRFFSLELGEFIPCPRTSDEWLMKQYNRMTEAISTGKFERVIGNHCKRCEQILNCQFGEVSMWSDPE